MTFVCMTFEKKANTTLPKNNPGYYIYNCAMIPSHREEFFSAGIPNSSGPVI